VADHDEPETPDVPSDEAEPEPADPVEPGPEASTDEPPADDDPTDDDPVADGDGEDGGVEDAAEDAGDDGVEDTAEGEVIPEAEASTDDVENADDDGVEDTAEVDVATDDETAADEAPEGTAAGRPGLVVPFVIAVAAVLALILGVAVLGGGDDDPGPDDEAAAEGEADEPASADTTAGTAVPPVTTAPGTATAGLLSELEPVDSDSWEPAGDDVTIGGAAHAETLVSGPIGTCDDGAAQTVTYDLAGGYTWLEGVVGLVDGTETGLTVEIGFEADGEQVWWKTFAEGESTRVQLDLTDAQELTVTATGLFPGADADEACVRAGYGDLTLR